tara:strand:+ start:3556 stop:4719 length:1164 start_codon:yes stop_codon:yes gene_type:complete
MKKHTIRDGAITLHLRENSDKWQVYINLKGERPIRQSTGTSNLDEAKQFASNLYDESRYKQKQGIAIRTYGFTAVADMYIKDLASNKDNSISAYRKHRTNTGHIERYLKPFFKDKSINEFQIKHITDYKRWRKTNYLKTVPSDNTIRLELNALAQVFKTAVNNGMCLQAEVPSISAPTAKNRRPDFQKQEIPIIKDKLQEYIDTAPDDRIRNRRIDLRDYVLLQLHIGCRNEELLNLGAKHLEKFIVSGQQCYIATIDGKTNQRRVFVDAFATDIINKRVQRHNDKLHNRLWQVVDFSNIFGNWIRWSGLEYNANNEKRTMYSLRHTYATQKIIDTKGDWGAVALQMGTSIEMLQKHYSHVLIENQAHVLDGKPQLDTTFNKLFELS